MTKVALARTAKAEAAIRQFGLNPDVLARQARSAQGGVFEPFFGSTKKDVRDPRFLKLAASLSRMDAMERALASPADVATLKLEGAADRLQYVYDALAILRKELGLNKTLLGFAGSPWTLACYLVEGGGSEDFPKTKALIKADPKMMHRILEILTDAVAQYLTRQFAAGADAIQIFDSWAGALTGADYEEFSLRYIRAVLERLPAGAPVILYAKGKSPQAAALAQTGVPCLGVDWTMPLSQVRQLAGRPICLQGNLDPEFMTGEPAAAAAATKAVLADNAGDLGHIFNLGHGITPQARIETFQAVVDTVVASGV
jgi:uroporphyrinogen decarboxylase